MVVKAQPVCISQAVALATANMLIDGGTKLASKYLALNQTIDHLFGEPCGGSGIPPFYE